ncbi:MAG: hypothetical protein ABIO48_02765 [Pedococcus sp.]
MTEPHAATTPAGLPIGWLRLTVQDGLLARVKVAPEVWVDDIPIRVARGENLVTLPTGAHRVVAQSAFYFGRAVTEVKVVQGQVTPLYYAPPLARQDVGRFGSGPVQPQGRLFLATVGVALVVGLLITWLR